MRRSRLAPLVALTLAACSSDAVGPTSDAGNFPYQLSANQVRVHGTTRILLLPARLAGGAAAPLTPSQIAAKYFGGADGGPVNVTFQLASGGTFTLEGEVAGWSQSTVHASELPLRGHVAPFGDGDYVLEAIHAADPAVDFGRFDNDGPDGFPNSGDDDGVVDGGVVVLNSDRNLYCNNGTGLGLHPRTNNRWLTATGDRFLTADDRRGGGKIAVTRYVLMSAVGCTGTDAAPATMAHELGHMLFGLPDLYHAVGTSVVSWDVRRWVVGCWDLMSAGSSWGCGPATPTFAPDIGALGAWTRTLIGWSTPTLVPVDRDATYELRSLATGGTVLRLPIAAGEYLLVEYREPRPGDSGIPRAGVLIYHIDENLPLLPTTPARNYRVRLVEADDDDALIRVTAEGGDRGAAGDAFGATRSELRPGVHSRATTTAGAPLPFAITQITVDASAHLARLRIEPIARP